MILKRIYKKFLKELWKFKYYLEKYKFQKKFLSFKDAKFFCELNSKTKNYNHTKINELKVYEFEKFSKEVIYDIDRHILTFLECFIIYFRQFPNDKALRVLDIGGSSGILALALKQRFGIEIEYNIVENSTLVDLINIKNFDHSNFFSSINEFDIGSSKNNLDFVYSKGSIHYFENPYEILKQIISLKPKIIFLCNLNFSKTEEFYSEYSMLRHHIQSSTINNFKNKNFNLSEKVLIPVSALNLDKVKEIFEPEYKLFKEFFTQGSVDKLNFAKSLFYQKIN
jgi:putative methyltransferase (TIGR04325 family)